MAIGACHIDLQTRNQRHYIFGVACTRISRSVGRPDFNPKRSPLAILLAARGINRDSVVATFNCLDGGGFSCLLADRGLNSTNDGRRLSSSTIVSTQSAPSANDLIYVFFLGRRNINATMRFGLAI